LFTSSDWFGTTSACQIRNLPGLDASYFGLQLIDRQLKFGRRCVAFPAALLEFPEQYPNLFSSGASFRVSLTNIIISSIVSRVMKFGDTLWQRSVPQWRSCMFSYMLSNTWYFLVVTDDACVTIVGRLGVDKI